MGWFSRKEYPSPQQLGPHLLIIASAGAHENAVDAVQGHTSLSRDNIRIELLAVRFFWVRLSAIMAIAQSDAPNGYIGKIAGIVDLLEYSVTDALTEESQGDLAAIGLVMTLQADEIAKRAGPTSVARIERASRLWSEYGSHISMRLREYTAVFQRRQQLDDATQAMCTALEATSPRNVEAIVKEDFEATARAVRELLQATGFKVR